MHFPCTSLPQQIYDPLTGRATHNTVVHQNDTLPSDHTFYDIQLDPNRICPHFLRGLNECSPHVTILDKTNFIRNSGSLRNAKRSIQTAVRNTDDYIRFYRMLFPQQLSGTDSRIMHTASIDHRIWTGKVNIFENAKTGFSSAMRPNGAD